MTTVVPEPAYVARIAPPPPPRPRPEQRRGIFFDVENTSRPQDIDRVLRHLMIDRVGIDTDFTAVGNWRVIGHETARLLAQNGANLVHSAPSTGVRDWSDLRIAVGAGVWLAGTRPGDMIDIVSDDQAFDAVGDVAVSLGVQYRRLSYRSITGHAVAERSERSERSEPSSGDGRQRRRRRGGRGRRDDDRRHADERRHHEAARYHAPAPRPHVPPPVAAAAVEDDAEAHTAPHDELIDVVRSMMGHAPGGVTLDQLANALREHGFRRTPGSPRLITRLKRIKELEVSRSGLIRFVGEEAASAEPIEPPDTDVDEGETGEAAEAVATETAGEGGQRRRRRRRGGRRRRGRRGGGGNGGGDLSTAPETGSDVIAAAPPSSFDGF